MQGPDQYDMDEGLMDELDGTMDDFDTKKMKPLVTITVAVAQGDDEKKPEAEEGADPTPDELEELQKALG
jgi:hypothetical protein